MTTVHAKVLYKLLLVLVNAKGSDDTPPDLQGPYHTVTRVRQLLLSDISPRPENLDVPFFVHYIYLGINYTYAGITKLLNVLKELKQQMAIIGDHTLIDDAQTRKETCTYNSKVHLIT